MRIWISYSAVPWPTWNLFIREPNYFKYKGNPDPEWLQPPYKNRYLNRIGDEVCDDWLEEAGFDVSQIADGECGEFDLVGEKPKLVCVWQGVDE